MHPKNISFNFDHNIAGWPITVLNSAGVQQRMKCMFRTTVAVLADISAWSPRKFTVFIVRKKNGEKFPKTDFFFGKQNHCSGRQEELLVG